MFRGDIKFYFQYLDNLQVLDHFLFWYTMCNHKLHMDCMVIECFLTRNSNCLNIYYTWMIFHLTDKYKNILHILVFYYCTNHTIWFENFETITVESSLGANYCTYTYDLLKVNHISISRINLLDRFRIP